MSAQYDALSQWSWRVIVSLIGISGHSCKNQERAHLVLALHPAPATHANPGSFGFLGTAL